jgi:hypothetical protein
MVEELFGVLMRFHREVVVPDIERIVGSRIETLRGEIAVANRETQANFDAVWKRFDRLESEYHALTAAVTRIEDRLES